MLVNEYINTDNLHSIQTMNVVNGMEQLRFDLKDELKFDEIDPMVQNMVAATNSNFYVNAIGKLKKYTIPDFPISTNSNNLLLDVGCGWGRWCFSANNSGFDTVGIDPCIDSVMSAIRISKQLNIKSKFFVGDACFLPFRKNLFDNCFSFSVLQHFIKDDVKKVLDEINFSLKIGGISQIHMLNKFGLRSSLMQIRNIFIKYRYFHTTYWSPKELIKLFESRIGVSKIRYETFFTQAQYNDYHLFTIKHKFIFKIAKFVSYIALQIPLLKYFADNVYLISKK